MFPLLDTDATVALRSWSTATRPPWGLVRFSITAPAGPGRARASHGQVRRDATREAKVGHAHLQVRIDLFDLLVQLLRHGLYRRW
jgi:hypothetical protein